MLRRSTASLFLFLFLFSCEEGEVLPSVTVEDCEGEVSLVKAEPATLYIGVTHDLVLNAPDGNTADLQISISDNSTADADLNGGNGLPWEVAPSRPGDLQLEVTDAGGKPVGSTTFRVKRIPDPVARLGNLGDGQASSGEFRVQGGVTASLDNFAYEARCDISGFELVYIARRQDPIQVINQGAAFNANARTLIQRAVPGDLYYFTNVRARCPGDPATRRINSLVFRIR